MTNHSKKRKFLATTLTATMVAAAVAPVGAAAATETGPFPDVSADHWAADAIAAMAKAGVIDGLPNGDFGVNNPLTRQSTSQIIAELLDLKTGPEENKTGLPDVKDNAWYTGAVNSLVEAGLMKGKRTTEGTVFAPGDFITRGEVAEILVRAYGLEDVNVDDVVLPFTDVADDAWYANSVKILHKENLIKGISDTEFSPRTQMGRGAFSLLAADADYKHGSKLPKPEVPEEVEVAVESVSAINANTIEVTFNNELEEVPAVEDFTIEGLDVKSVNLKTGTDATYVLVTNVHESGKTYALQHGEQTVEFTAITVVSELQAVQTNVAAQVGTDATVQFKVLDQNGNPVANKEVYVRAGSSSASAAFPAVEKVVTSDANGLITFTYTRNDETNESVTAYVVDQPLIRNTNAVVSWTVAPVGLISVTSSHAGKVGHNTIVEYDLTFKDEDGRDLARGENVNYQFAVSTETVPNLNGNTVEIQRTNGTWETVTGGTFDLKEAGKAKVRVYYNAPTTAGKEIEVTPTFFYDDNGNSLLDSTETRAIAQNLTFVDQVPSITITPVNDSVLVSDSATKDYKVKVVDQFGNPFRGVVTLGALEDVDGLASTPAPQGAYSFAVDSDGDEVFEIDPTTSIDFSVGADDLDENSEVIVALSSDPQSLTFAAFVDTNGDGFIGGREVSAVAPKVTFGQVAPTAINLESDTNLAAVGGTIKYDLSFLNVADEKFVPETDIVLALVKEDGSNPDIPQLGTSISVTDAQGNTVGADSGNNYVIAAAALKSDLKVTVTPGAGAGNYKLVAYSDINKNEAQETDEVAKTAEFEVITAEVSKGELTSDAGFEFAKGSYNFANALGAVEYTYEIQDQSGNTITAPTAGTRVTWTVTNNSDEDITVTQGVTPDTIEAGKSKTYTATIASGASDDKLTVTTTDNALVDVKAQATGISTSGATATTYFYNATTDVVENAGDVYNGSVISFTTDTDGNRANNDTDGNFLALDIASIGQVIVDSTDATTFTGGIKYQIGVNTASEKAFEAALEVGSTVTATVDSTGNILTLKLDN